MFAARSADFGRAALKVPYLGEPPADEYPENQPVGHGPMKIEPEGLTGPFVLRATKTLDDASEMLEAACHQQRSTGTGRPLARLFWMGRLGGRPAALYERLDAPTLADRLVASREDVSREDVLALLPGLAGAVAALHVQFGAHGDLKPAHVMFDGDDTVLIDPLVTAEWVGSIGYTLPIPRGIRRHARLADLLAIAAIMVELHAGFAPWSGRLVYIIANRYNGRFAWGNDLEDMRQMALAPTTALPPREAHWVRRVVDAAFAALDLHGARGRISQLRPPGGWVSDAEPLAHLAPSEAWLDDMLAEMRFW